MILVLKHSRDVECIEVTRLERRERNRWWRISYNLVGDPERSDYGYVAPPEEAERILRNDPTIAAKDIYASAVLMLDNGEIMWQARASDKVPRKQRGKS